mmetsp:Transcript_25510/g.35155  ORF Transcript_25510/g.35155 Transcript_25510/m.35155 type:complete len:230 (+) Transcript_25510:2459-3148(+)
MVLPILGVPVILGVDVKVADIEETLVCVGLRVVTLDAMGFFSASFLSSVSSGTRSLGSTTLTSAWMSSAWMSSSLIISDFSTGSIEVFKSVDAAVISLSVDAVSSPSSDSSVRDTGRTLCTLLSKVSTLTEALGIDTVFLTGTLAVDSVLTPLVLAGAVSSTKSSACELRTAPEYLCDGRRGRDPRIRARAVNSSSLSSEPFSDNLKTPALDVDKGLGFGFSCSLSVSS